MWYETNVIQFHIPFRHFPAGTEENYRKTLLSTVGILAQMRTGYLRNTSYRPYLLRQFS
jgi:hypothetical protein